ncbi:TIGR02391 family protein [Bradyrhizobium sp. SBR1B]|uniref:TIGR02391 family protein n=1 Tax=Bradyrhizobium sp. SBR1B TaxID=2663836 RepID=UPI001605DEEA|nr:TIGR02391 family protein [Bradyrhizobium sp. SBR1B]MBB4377059.1 uncharacterized protein (TIGR02391 family) [Bradyrhizobium sp. SBR1B]
MGELHERFPNADELLALTPDAFAPILLRIAANARQNGMFVPSSILTMTFGSGMTSERGPIYPHPKNQQVESLVGETIALLGREGMIHPAPGTNGQYGWMVLSTIGEAALDGPDGYELIRALRTFPKNLLHPRIEEKAYAALQRGDHVAAVRDAFTDVEIYVREAAGLTLDDIGTDLMRTAFNEKNGKLSDQSLPKAERESFAHLFAGSIGAYKNPHSHRSVVIDNLREAQRQVLLASHLLYIVDAAKARLG